MHDSTLISILFEWKDKRATLSFRTHGVAVISIVADGVTELHVPHDAPWGPSVSVNRIIGPMAKASGESIMEVEMQSGDVIRVVARSFLLPNATD